LAPLAVVAGLGYHTLGVMRGLEPRIHEAVQRPRPYGCSPLRFIMDCRVKPGNDER
jgi:hypothetical protein